MPAAPSTHSSPEIDPRGMRVIWLLLIAAFVAILNETTMGIAIPHLNADLGLPPELGQWLTSAFMLTMAVVIPTTGFLLQRFTTRQVFLAAMIAFTLGTLVCLIAPGFVVLLIGRVIQAAGTGVMMPLLMTTIMDVVPPMSRGRIMGRVGLVMSLAPAIGPTLSGAVLESLGWRWLFGIVLPIAVIALGLGAKWMVNLGETRKAPIDALSVVLSAIAFGSIVYGLSEFGSAHGGSGGASPQLIGGVLLAIGAAFLTIFIWRQLVLQRRDAALLDLRVFRSRNFSFSMATITVVALVMFGTLTLLPQYLQNVAGLDALSSGLILLPGSVLMGVLAPLMGRIYDARGPLPLLLPGSLLIIAALAFYSTAGAHTPWPLLCITQIAMSVGLAMSFTPLISASLGSLPRHLYSHGSAVLNTLQQVGGAAGVAILIGLYSSRLHAGEAEGLPTAEAGQPGTQLAFLVAALLALVPAVLSFFIVKPKEGEPAPEGAAR